MASSDEEKSTTIGLKLLVDKTRNKVVAAEANEDFVDILLSFLTLPLGTIVRATKDQPAGMNTSLMRCMYNLYESVENLSADNFVTEICKTILLNPRNPLAEYCMNLKLHVDDYYPDSYFQCSNWSNRHWYSCDYSQATCSCRGTFTEQVFLKPPHSTDDYQGAFVKVKMTFLISDDLKVMTNSPSYLVQLFSNLGLNDVNQITEISVAAGLEEVSRLLKYSLISKSPLTDVFLPCKKGKVDNTILPEPNYIPPSLPEVQGKTSTSKLSLKIILRKSTNSVLFAEASDDFVDFLFSFFTLPLGSVVKLLDGNSGLGCADNLFRDVNSLDEEWLTIPPENLLDAGVKGRYKCLKQPLRIQDREDMYYYSQFVDPRYRPGQEKYSGRFIKPHYLFVASDDLTLTPLSSASSIGFLKEHKVPISDIEEQVILVGEAGALCILKASLTSASALTDGLKALNSLL
ncbi:hypothetical protein ACH5RR_031448 [Cinchona calisaya]|uniref:Uncharacterized protein n=1 Tax=Cinchona calisaya TaxID=153742 RepID=A0ABD2YH81_9GENT